MGVYVIKLPDVGEGVAEAELVEWNVAPGDFVREDQIVAAVMTDKATVEIPSDVEGTVIWIAGKIGETLAVGSDLIRIETSADAVVAHETAASAEPDRKGPVAGFTPDVKSREKPKPALEIKAASPRNDRARPLAAPSVRGRAREAGADLHYIHGSGPAGRISHEDLDAFVASRNQPTAKVEKKADTSVREIPVVGLRRKIAERLANAKRRIPHITIIEEIDVTALEDVREQLNADRREGRVKLTMLPFLMASIVRAVREQPGLNAHYDDEAGIIREFAGVHIGIATQTKAGLMVPVVRHAEMLSIWDQAAELARVAESARNATATRDELTGSTITISSLGALGAIATTPIINHPEVAIVGVNRMEIRPSWNGNEFVPRKMMNLSSSFDHRVIDGWDAAIFVKRLKTLLETPALIFVEN
jgi:2-oxoisovalerate dehydrogenase E2 component (dihydrolipoyl transacylase)